MKTNFKTLYPQGPNATRIQYTLRMITGAVLPSFLLLITGFLLTSVSLPTFALEQPRALSTDQRIKVVSYKKDDVVQIQGRTFITTQIIFGDSEKIIDVQGGDAAAWIIGVDRNLANVLNIKPTIVDSHSNLSVITSDDASKKRFYRFELNSQSGFSTQPGASAKLKASNKTDNKTDDLTYSIEFIYPDDVRTKLLEAQDFERTQKEAILSSRKNPKSYHWDYRFSGSRSIMPLHIFDDGKFTYFQLRENQVVPAIFAVNNAAGQESLVNTRRVDDYLIVQQVAPQFTLRSGNDAVASVFNTRLIASLNR